jgi:hypothetical protein
MNAARSTDSMPEILRALHEHHANVVRVVQCFDSWPRSGPNEGPASTPTVVGLVQCLVGILASQDHELEQVVTRLEVGQAT